MKTTDTPFMKHQVIIADDHAIVRDGLHRLLEKSGQHTVIAEADSGEQLITLCRKQLPQLVIMDISMPGMGGLEAIRRLRSKWPVLNILVFSIYKNAQLAKRVLEAGALAYVTKNSDSEQLFEAITAVTAGNSFISKDIRSDNVQSFESKPLENLSARELDIFTKVAEGMNTAEISRSLFLSEKTVANNVSIIKRKLSASSTAEMVHLALNEGLIMPVNGIQN